MNKKEQRVQADVSTGQEHLFENINSRSDIAMEVISYKSNFFEKWGITLFTIIFMILLVLSYFFKYPDTVEGVASLSSKNAPKAILTNQAGRLIKALDQENLRVKKNQIIGWIESPEKGNHQQILDLYQTTIKIIDAIRDGKKEWHNLFPRSFMQLGEMQNDYQNLITNIETFEEFREGFYSQKKTTLAEDIKSLQAIRNNLRKQEKIIIDNNKLARESFDINKKLYENGVISADEYRQQKSKYLNNEYQLPGLGSNVITNLREEKSKITDIESIDYSGKMQERQTVQLVFILKAKIEEWLNKFCIYAPIQGRIHFDGRIQQYQFLKIGDEIGYVFPDNSTLYAEILLPQYNIGKVDTGMEVQLRFDGYPYQEFGSVIGKLIHISEIANEKGFIGTVELKNGLLTNQQTMIKYREGLQARAVVITKEMSLLKRLWYGVIKRLDTEKQ